MMGYNGYLNSGKSNGMKPYNNFNPLDYDNPQQAEEAFQNLNTPPESNPPMYEDPILPGGRPVPPTPLPPSTDPIDPGLSGGDSSSGYGPDLLPNPPSTVPIDPGLVGGDSPAGINPPPLFQVHTMYDCATGQGYTARTQADHDYFAQLGYVHDLSECSMNGNGGSSSIKDFRLIGGLAVLFIGGLIVRSYRK